jgi:hypothetical protein
LHRDVHAKLPGRYIERRKIELLILTARVGFSIPLGSHANSVKLCQGTKKADAALRAPQDLLSDGK